MPMKSACRTTRCSGWDRIYDLMRIYSPAADLERSIHLERRPKLINDEEIELNLLMRIQLPVYSINHGTLSEPG